MVDHSETTKDLFQEGIRCFNAEKFYEAHEEWEHIWLSTSDQSKLFYQGLIQLAGGFHHAQRNRIKPAMTLLAKGIEKLSAYSSNYNQIDLADLIQNAQLSLVFLQTQSHQEIDFPKIRHHSIDPPSSRA